MDGKGFLEAERRATELVDALSSLKQQVKSYSSAQAALDGVQIKLESMIQATEELVNESRKIISVVGSIGGPEIERQLQLTQRQITELGESSARQNVALLAAVTHVDEALTPLLGKSTDTQRAVRGLQTVCYVAIVLSGVAAILGIMILNSLQ